jgi:flagellar motor switch protein FliM
MPDILSQDEIDALLTATGGDEAEDMGAGSAPSTINSADSRPILTHDFKHPTRVSKDQTRTLENLHSNLARLMASSFSTMQRSVVDCDIAFVDQTTYAEFIMSLSNPSCSYTFTIEPLGGPAIIDFSLPVAYSFIDRQFGGVGGNPPQEGRSLTSIERTVMTKVVTRTLADLEATWEQLIKIQVSDAELETNPEFMQVASPSDTVVLIAFEVNSTHASGLVNLCYPYFTLEPVMAYLNVQTWASREKGNRETTKEERMLQLDRVYAPVKAQLGQAKVSLGDVLNLEEGDVLRLDTSVRDDAIMFVGTRPKFKGKPGLNGKRRAIMLTEPIVKADESVHMTEVARTENEEL